MTGNPQIRKTWSSAGRRGLLRLLGGAAILAMFAAVASPAFAGPNQPVRYAPTEAPASQGKATLDVVVVKADKSGKVEPALKKLERQLSFTGYTGFSTVTSDSVKLGKGQSDTVNGGPGHRLKAEVVGFSGEKARVRLQILKGSESRMDTTVVIPKGKAFLVKGPKVDGGAMVYVINYR